MNTFEYFGVRTGEGELGVVHFVYTGNGVRYGDLSKLWVKISGFWNVSISKVRDYPGIIDELTRQHQKVRYFHSRYWSMSRKSSQISLILEKGEKAVEVKERYKLRGSEDSLARCKRVKL